MPTQLSLYPQLFTCESMFHNVREHGPVEYIVEITFYINGRKAAEKRTEKPQYYCENCIKELNLRRKRNSCLDQYNDFKIKKLRK